MAHLLHNPFQKPFEFPRPGPLLTPPDTEAEQQIQHQTVPLPTTNGLGIELEPTPTQRSTSITEVPISRRLQYIQSGPREARERTVHRSVRWLVVVTPPPSFSQEHGNLGHTLSVGSPERLSQGLLMPLLQTMSSQLSAIAREFAFPSTTGLCLYLHTSHGGIPITPRITDESWPLLWAHLFEPRSPASASAPQLPIGGRIEFDIDPNKARWLDAWLGLLRRENLDVPVSAAPSRRGSLSHFREDSRTTFHDDRTEEPLEGAPVILPPRISKTPVHRHVPRKLSLLDRLESSSARSGSKFAARAGNSPSPPAFLDTVQRPSIGLSPIVQEDEPKTAHKDIDTFVNSWRASASIMPSPLAATGQTSLDPVNLPNNIEITGDEDVRSELDLNDFQWSVSSVGPAEYEDEDDFDTCSFESWRLPSVHMDRRLEGSVCLTPTTCTSWGPPDWEEDRVYEAHFAALAMAAMLPSPDIATRMLEDCPPTPSTATSWGPPLDWPPSPSARSLAASVDVAQRCMSEVPMTPSTATSWGPPLSWPPSPVRSELSYAGSVDIGQRCMSEVPLTPSTATSWGPPLSYPPSPATPYHVHTPDVGQRIFNIEVPHPAPAPRPRDLSLEGEAVEPWRNVWPYISTTSAQSSPYTFVFPQRPATPPSEPVEPQSVSSSPAPFAFGWPFFDVSTEPTPIAAEVPPERSVEPIELDDVEDEPVVRVKKLSPFTVVFDSDPESAPASVPSTPQATQEGPWNQVWPYGPSSSVEETPASEVHSPSLVWPYFNASNTTEEVEEAEEVKEVKEVKEVEGFPTSLVWPYFDASGAAEETEALEALEEPSASLVWPYFNASGAVEEVDVSQEPSTSLVWPYFNASATKDEAKPPVEPRSSGHEACEVPPTDTALVSICEATDVSLPNHGEPWDHVWPYTESKLAKEAEDELAPFRALSHVWPYSVLFDANASAPDGPWNFRWPYPKPMYNGLYMLDDSRAAVNYPYFNLYPAVYPTFDLYPAVTGTLHHRAPMNLAVELKSSYPTVQPYPSVYPYLEIYPGESMKHDSIRVVVSPPIEGQSYHPAIDLYGPVYPSDVQMYPWNLYHLYPTTDNAKSEQPKDLPTLTLTPGYPTLNLYAPVYPHNIYNIYPAVRADVKGVSRSNSLSTRLEMAYPVMEIYDIVYPYSMENIYPKVEAEKATETKSSVVGTLNALKVQLAVAYPDLALYSPVYPHNLTEIYPAVIASGSKAIEETLGSVVVRLHTHYPTLGIYPSGYPWNLSSIYPSIVAEKAAKATGIVVLEHKLEYPHVQPYRPVYPFNVENIYSPVSVALEEKRPVRSSARHKSPVHRAQHHGHHVKRSLSTSKIPPPPVPPLPQNVQSWRPINPTSREPLSGKRVYVCLPVQLPPRYPSISPYPAVYPYLEIYPEVSAACISRPTLPRRKAKRSHEELHQLVFYSIPAYLPRRKPKFSHLQLHEKVFGSIISPPTSLRRLPVPPQISVPVRPVVETVVPPSVMLQGSPSASPSPRARSGTVSQRPMLPTPTFTKPNGTNGASTILPLPSDSPPRVTRRLPSIPQNGSPRGLPSDPAVIRRTSMMPPVPKTSPFTSLPTVPEPLEVTSTPISPPSARRPLPHPVLSPASPDSPQLPRSARPVSTLVPPAGLNASGLSRSNTLPPRPIPRSRRDAATAQSGIVAGLTRAFDSNDTNVSPPRSLVSTLSQFPTPPRPPLPPVPNSRPVSKLDRSKYPYN
ncbi:hypothetical protein BDY19DRAFT_482973 [Irpex rosettiformis]|uniref:Uncharacterized protein n=1 Tax=Irpex rosettiformis TaxID=378272 RepID=A0ACB8UDV0_9APHY|nr:hypothetical protein BDY19DRAFT_482973 [Irpex rosettiformis]